MFNYDFIVQQIDTQPLDEALRYAISGIRDYYVRINGEIIQLQQYCNETYEYDNELLQRLSNTRTELQLMHETLTTLLLEHFMKRIQK